MRTGTVCGKATLAVTFVLTVGAAALVFGQQSNSSSASASSQNGQTKTSVTGGGRASAGGSVSGGASGGGFPRIDRNKTQYAVWYTKVPDKSTGKVDPNVDSDHWNYMRTLVQDGTLVIEGLFSDGTGAMAVIQAKDDSVAESIVANEPAVRTGKIKYTIKRWLARHGVQLEGPVSAGGGGQSGGGQRGG